MFPSYDVHQSILAFYKKKHAFFFLGQGQARGYGYMKNDICD